MATYTKAQLPSMHGKSTDPKLNGTAYERLESIIYYIRVILGLLEQLC
jgi:hypothetical protein